MRRRRALRRQQPRHYPIFIRLSVSSHFLISAPPRFRSYLGDNLSDTGGLDDPAPLGLAQRVRRHRTIGVWPPITLPQIVTGLPAPPAVLNAIESRLRGYGLGKVSPECHSLCWNMLQPHDDGFPRIGISDSLPACVCSMPCWLHCEAVWTSFPTSVVDRTPLIAYPTSAWRRFRCFSCRARRSSLISGSSRRAMGDPTARVCSAYRRSRATITFVTCWTRRRRRCFIRHLLKRSHSWGGSRAGSTCSAGSTAVF